MVGLAYGRDGDADIPMGLAALSGMREASAACRRESDGWVLGNPGFQRILALCGDTVSLLDRASCCWWGCGGGPHAMEYLLGGCVTAARAGIELALDGFYDEAVAMCRGIAERVNLLVLFRVSADDQALWASDDTARFRHFRPVRVRRRLEDLGHEVPFPEEYYRALSARGVHASSIPQVYNRAGRPLAGGVFQAAGLEVCLTELGGALGQAGVIGLAALVHLPVELRGEVCAPAATLAEAVPAASSISLRTLARHLDLHAQDRPPVDHTPTSPTPADRAVADRAVADRAVADRGEPSPTPG